MGLVEKFEGVVRALPFDPQFAGLEVVTSRTRRQGRTVELALTLDRAGGMDLDACGRVAARVNAELADETEPYTLEVESAGIDRPLLDPVDYDRFCDRDVVVKTSLPIASEYTHRGRLVGRRGNLIVLAGRTGEIPIPLEIVKSAHIEYDYRADLRRAKREKRERQ